MSAPGDLMYEHQFSEFQLQMQQKLYENDSESLYSNAEISQTNKGGSMSLKAPVPETIVRELIPEDSYHVVCYAVYDLGTHKADWQGSEYLRHEIVLIFEVPDQRIEYEKDGEKIEGPKAISKRYTFSMGDKANLRKDMETWRGKAFTSLEAADFDFEKLVGANAIIQVMHKEKKNGDKYAYIGSITKLLKGTALKNPENKLSFFSFYSPYVDEEGFHFPDNMPDWVQGVIKESDEYDIIANFNDDPKEEIVLTDNPETGGDVSKKIAENEAVKDQPKPADEDRPF